VAKLERPRDLPEFSEADQDKMIFGRAAVMLEQLKRDREDALKREDELKVQLAESVLARQGDANKIEFLELENAELRNNAATLQADLNNFRTFLSNARRTIDMLNKILDSFGIKAPEKKRKAKKNSVTIEAVKPTSTND
jgi:uncharacterized protein (DUF885 family)